MGVIFIDKTKADAHKSLIKKLKFLKIQSLISVYRQTKS